jgi:type II secretory pathway component PulF
VTLRHRIRFYQQLGVMVRSGLPIRAGLMRLRERMAERELIFVSEKVNAGERLGDAFAAAGFSEFETNLVVAGERSAQLDTVFEHLSEYWARDLALRQDLVRPLIYPIVVLHLALILWAVIDGLTLPLPVALVYFTLRLAGFWTAGFVVYMLVRTSWANEGMQRLWLWIPIIGGALQAASAYRWITALRLEFGAGVLLSRAVADAWRASGYPGGKQVADGCEEELRAGGSLAKLVHGWRQLPRDWADFIETGEVSGALEEAFKNLEKEAGRNWSLAQQRMAEWVPKIAYFVILLIVATVVGQLVYKMEIAPMVDAEKQIDDALGK